MHHENIAVSGPPQSHVFIYSHVLCVLSCAWTNRKISNIRRTKSQNLNDYPLVLQSSLSNPLKPGVKSRMKTTKLCCARHGYTQCLTMVTCWIKWCWVMTIQRCAQAQIRLLLSDLNSNPRPPNILFLSSEQLTTMIPTTTTTTATGNAATMSTIESTHSLPDL